MKQLHLADGVTLPAAIDEQHLIALGKTRSGKSSVLRLFVESLLDRQERVCVIDPKGDWWGLKASADGRSAGYGVVIFGGEKADVPINEHAGAQVAELVATGNRPCVIDLGGWMVSERTRFFIAFASTLFRSIDQPLQLVIDECHNFAPQQKTEKGGDAPKMLHWANRLASEGAGKGITLKSASQRPQKTHKDYVTSHETIVAMRVVHPLDRNAIKDWIDGCGDPAVGREVLTTLAGMQRGEGWVWSPEAGFGPQRIQFPLFRTYDSFAAPTGGARKKLKGWAAVDLDDVRSKLAAVVKEAEANDPKKLRAEILELKKQLTAAAAASPAKPTAIAKPKTVPAVSDHQLKRLEAAAGKISAEADRQAERLAELVKAQRETAATIVAAVRTVRAPAATAVPPPARPAAAAATAIARPVRQTPPAIDGEALNPSETAVLQAAAQFPNGANRTRIAVYSGRSMNSSSFQAAFPSLVRRGLLQARGDLYLATEAGLAIAGPGEMPPPGPALVAHWSAKLNPSEQRVLQAIVDVYPGRITREAVAEQTGQSPLSSSFQAAFPALRNFGLIEGTADFRASEDLVGA